jgi:hypothetical protein
MPWSRQVRLVDVPRPYIVLSAAYPLEVGLRVFLADGFDAESFVGCVQLPRHEVCVRFESVEGVD